MSPLLPFSWRAGESAMPQCAACICAGLVYLRWLGVRAVNCTRRRGEGGREGVGHVHEPALAGRATVNSTAAPLRGLVLRSGRGGDLLWH